MINHTKIIKYIKPQFKNMFDDKIKYHEQYVCNSLNKLIKKTIYIKKSCIT